MLKTPAKRLRSRIRRLASSATKSYYNRLHVIFHPMLLITSDTSFMVWQKLTRPDVSMDFCISTPAMQYQLADGTRVCTLRASAMEPVPRVSLGAMGDQEPVQTRIATCYIPHGSSLQSPCLQRDRPDPSTLHQTAGGSDVQTHDLPGTPGPVFFSRGLLMQPMC